MINLNKIIIFLYVLIFSLAASSIGTINLSFDKNNNCYTVPINLGTPYQTFTVQVDTTTSETWVPSKNTSYSVSPKYDHSKSKTADFLNKTIEIYDEDGDVRGKSTYDNIQVGKYELNKFGFVQILDYENGFKDYSKGKLGLGNKQEHGETFDFIKSLKNQGLIEKEIFSLNPNEKILSIGDYPRNSDVYSFCNITEVDDLDNDYRASWVCEMTHIFFGIFINKIDLDDFEEINARVSFDTAYPYISVPKRHLNLFKEKYIKKVFNDTCNEIKDNEETYFICENDDKNLKNSNITFILGGFGYTLTSKELFKKIDGDKVELLIRFYVENDDIFSFGIPFINSYITVFDFEKSQVGFYEGNRINLYADWILWLNGLTPKQQRERIKKLIIGCSVLGAILAFIVIFLIVRACRRKNLEDEHGPLVKNEEMPQ
jgi:hypothetical protein